TVLLQVRKHLISTHPHLVHKLVSGLIASALAESRKNGFVLVNRVLTHIVNFVFEEEPRGDPEIQVYDACSKHLRSMFNATAAEFPEVAAFYHEDVLCLHGSDMQPFHYTMRLAKSRCLGYIENLSIRLTNRKKHFSMISDVDIEAIALVLLSNIPRH